MGKLRDLDLVANRSPEPTPMPSIRSTARTVLLASALATGGGGCGKNHEPQDGGDDTCADNPDFCIAPMVPPTDSGPETGDDDADIISPMPPPIDSGPDAEDDADIVPPMPPPMPDPGE